MYVVGNTGWTIERDHRLDEDGVETFWRLRFDDKVEILMGARHLKALTARLVLEVNDIEPYEPPA